MGNPYGGGQGGSASVDISSPTGRYSNSSEDVCHHLSVLSAQLADPELVRIVSSILDAGRGSRPAVTRKRDPKVPSHDCLTLTTSTVAVTPSSCVSLLRLGSG